MALNEALVIGTTSKSQHLPHFRLNHQLKLSTHGLCAGRPALRIQSRCRPCKLKILPLFNSSLAHQSVAASTGNASTGDSKLEGAGKPGRIKRSKQKTHFTTPEFARQQLEQLTAPPGQLTTTVDRALFRTSSLTKEQPAGNPKFVEEAPTPHPSESKTCSPVAERLPARVAVLIYDATNAACAAYHHSRINGTDPNLEFTKALTRLQETVSAASCVAVFDGQNQAPMRKKSSPNYKAPQQAKAAKSAIKDGRDFPIQRFGPSMALVEAARQCGAQVIVSPEGWEGDDVIATVCARMMRGHPTGLIAVASGDSDMQQMLRSGAVVWLHMLPRPTKAFPDRIEIVTAEGFEAKYKFPPTRYADMLALAGKPQSGVPGVPGIGRKTAKRLIQRFGSVRQLLETITAGNLKSSRQTMDALAHPKVEDMVMESWNLVSLRIDENAMLPADVDLDWPSA